MRQTASERAADQANWAARRVRSALGSLYCALGDLSELRCEAECQARRGTPAHQGAMASRADDITRLMQTVIALREQVRSLSPLPIAEEE